MARAWGPARILVGLLGRIPLSIAACVFSVAACAVFLVAHGTGELYVARPLQGIAIGLASGPIGAALIELQPASTQIAPLVTSAFFTLGLVAGVGYGLAFLGAFRTVMALATPDQRAALVTAIFAVGYLAFSIPALIAGVATEKFGLHSTALVYSASIAALVAATLVILLMRSGNRPLPSSPAPVAFVPPGPCTVPPCRLALGAPDGDRPQGLFIGPGRVLNLRCRLLEAT
jgi:hypothetical protein